MLGRTNRTCAAGLRHSVRLANCKRSPLAGFEVPNVGHPFSLFAFPFSTFVVSESHLSFFFNSLSREAFFKPQRRPTAASLVYFALKLHSQPPAFLWSLFLLCPSGFLCVGNFATKSPFHVSSIAGDHRVPGGRWSTKTPPGKPVKTHLPFFNAYGNQAKPRTWTQSFSLG